jgi:hemolysin III
MSNNNYQATHNKRSREEIANTWTHLIGVVLVIPITWSLLQIHRTYTHQDIIAILIFCISVFLLYASSTVYHWANNAALKHKLRYLDHINIYLLIAASYTPILLIAIKGTLGWTFFFILWGMFLLGAIYKIFFLGKHPYVSLTLYLVMGWSGLFIAKAAWDALPAISLWMLLAEGISYSSGTYFFAHDDTKKYYHAVWHIFVLGGTFFHYLAVLYMLSI